MSNSEMSPNGDKGQGSGSAASRTVAPLGDLSHKDAKRLLSTLPDQYDWAWLFGSANHPAAAVGLTTAASIPFSLMTQKPLAVVATVAIAALATWVAYWATQAAKKSNKEAEAQRCAAQNAGQHTIDPQNIDAARTAIKQAIKGSAEGEHVELCLVAYQHSDAMAFFIPSLDAQWAPPKYAQKHAKAVAAAMTSSDVDNGKRNHL